MSKAQRDPFMPCVSWGHVTPLWGCWEAHMGSGTNRGLAHRGIMWSGFLVQPFGMLHMGELSLWGVGGVTGLVFAL